MKRKFNRARQSRRVIITLAVPALVLATAASGSAARVASAPAATSPASFTQDVITVGMPNFDRPDADQTGAVDVYWPDGRSQVLTEESLNLAAHGEGDFNRFGAAIAVADLNSDGYSDLVVGAPATPTLTLTGRVYVLFGTPSGFSGGKITILTEGSAADKFGTAVAVTSRGGGLPSELWIGAPGREVDGKTNAGVVYRFSISKTGAITPRSTLSQNTANIPGTAETNDQFGEVLAPTNDGVVVGIPHEDVGTAVDAGAVSRLRTTDAGTLIAGKNFDQNTAGVADTAEAGDRFGASVSGFGYAVGVPGEDVGKVKDAGAVQLFTKPASGFPLKPTGPLTQNSPGVPGTAQAGDRFGASVSNGVFNCLEAFSVAIGAPGEDIGSIADAGSVTIAPLPIGGDPTCPKIALSQGSGLPGSAEAGDAVGAALSTVTGGQNDNQDRIDALLIGAPGEDIGTHSNPGRATVWDYQGHVLSFGAQSGDLAQLGYGSVFGNEGL